MSEALEQMLQYAPNVGTRQYMTIDIYANGISKMFSKDLVGPGGMLPVSGTTGSTGSYGGYNEFKIEPIGTKENSPWGVLKNADYNDNILERFRLPEKNHDKTDGFHMNYEELIPGMKKSLINIHIDMEEKDSILKLKEDKYKNIW